MKLSFVIGALALVAAQLAMAAPIKPQKINEAMVYTISGKSYQQAREDLNAAIEERGMVVSAVSHVKDMLDRTSADLGYKTNVYDTGGETVLFCKADLSQAMMRENPHNIALCPYGISIYTLPGEANKVFLSYKIPPSLKVYQPIHRLLDDIIQSVAE
ncbi:MAG: hypothetical protein K0U21_04770 [Proteobacteria bacterium]|nr:hypothetical protein [Pseudomonadota bacterium]